VSIRIQQANLQQTQQTRQFRVRCPECGQKSILAHAALPDAAAERIGVGYPVVWGVRVCPDAECGALIFIVIDTRNDSIIESFPPESIDFDSTDLPPAVLEAFKEAVECHAHACYKASVIMVRKTLEEVCADREASGNNLKERLENLRGKLLLPPEMFDALHDLRLLGNDAAHIELKDFDAIDKEKVEVALDIGKEILKAAYQYKAIMGRLDALKVRESGEAG
jgi:hypothetical protein